MKKITAIVSLVLVLITACKGQPINNNNIKKNTMEYLDKEYYKKMQKTPQIGINGDYTDTNGDEVQVMSRDDAYTVRTEKKGTPITIVKGYRGELNYLAYSAQEFYNFPVGTTIYYDDKGNVVKQINENLPYKFSVAQVCELIKQNLRSAFKHILFFRE